METIDFGMKREANGTNAQALIDFDISVALEIGQYRIIGNIFDDYESSGDPYFYDTAAGNGGDDNSIGMKFTLAQDSLLTLSVVSPGYFAPDGTRIASNNIGSRNPIIFAKESSSFLGGVALDNGPSTAPWQFFQSKLQNRNGFRLEAGDYVFWTIQGIASQYSQEFDFNTRDFYASYEISLSISPMATYRLELPAGPLIDHPQEGTSGAGGAAGESSILVKVIRVTGTDVASTITLAIDPTSGTEVADGAIIAPRTVSFAPGEREKLVTLTWAADDLPELDEVVKIVTNLPADAVVGALPRVTLVNDDGEFNRDNLIKWALRQAEKFGIDPSTETAKFLEKAYDQLIEVRSTQFPGDEIARDAEYYLQGLVFGAEGNLLKALTFPLGYNALKGAIIIWEEQAKVWEYIVTGEISSPSQSLLQSNDNPNTPPGGTLDAYEGTRDFNGGQWRRFLDPERHGQQHPDDDLGRDVNVIGRASEERSFRISDAGVNYSISTKAVVEAPATGAIIVDLVGGGTLAGASGSDVIMSRFSGTSLLGEGGDDLLVGLGGAQTLIGGAGNDLLIVDSAGDALLEEADGGADTVLSSADFTLAGGQAVEVLALLGNDDRALVGNDLAQTLLGNDGASSLAGLAGSDTLIGGAGNDRLDGGIGEDTAVFVGNRADFAVTTIAGGLTVTDLRASSPEGADSLYGVEWLRFNDTVISTAPSATPNADTLTGTDGANTIDALVGADRVLGLAGNDSLFGNADDDTLLGGSGNDSLDGGAGADSMVGGAGNDSYVVGDPSDRIVETRTGGADTVHSSMSWTLGAHLEDLVLTGDAAIDGTGNNLANVITGNDAANTLLGGGRADTLIGGGGDDLYLIDATDVLIEQAGGGNDTVVANATFALPDHIEVLRFNGTANVRGDGNAEDNFMLGNVANNRLLGYDGNDTLNGGLGNDTLQGGEGADSLVGGEGADRLDGGNGNDTYVLVDADVVIELANAGIDTVLSNISYALPGAVENLTLLGSADLSGTGNALDNVLTGNGGANVLRGLGGHDRLSGGQAGDTLEGGLGADTLTGSGGLDQFLWLSPLEGGDTLVDFRPAEDKLAFAAGGFGGLAVVTVSQNAAAGGAAQFVYTKATGLLEWDADGAGAGAAVTIATLSNKPTLAVSDFLLV